ncbi:MAG TPA: HEAT repeat domain-containing protein, partial [Myxococcaceae bacterium]|nr:HEAT repeat domain-containing protein [Myxococcaceae bacterium]
PLVRLSGASEATTRGRAVHYLSRLEGPEARRVVLSALQDESSTVREAAISAVERLSLTQARDGLRQLLLDPDQMIRIGAASALLSIDPEQAEHVLSTLENQPLDEAFLSFLTVLPMLVINESTYEQVRKLIAKKSKAGDLKQRLGAAALDVFAFKFRTQHPYSSRAHEPAEQPVTFWGRRFASFLEEPDKAGSWISRMLKRFSPQRAKSLPSTLSFKDDERSALELSRLDLPHLQLAGARTLLKQGHPEGLRTLSALLKSEDANIRGLALVSLQETPVTEALLESFLGASHDPDARVRSEAAEALGARGGSGVTERLVELVRDPDETVRVAAIESLGRIQEHQAIEPLQRRLDSGASAAERDAILTALWSISSASPA